MGKESPEMLDTLCTPLMTHTEDIVSQPPLQLSCEVLPATPDKNEVNKALEVYTLFA